MIAEHYNHNTGIFIYQAACDGDDCEARGEERGSESIAIIVAIQDGWKVVRTQKFSGTKQELLCPACARGAHAPRLTGSVG